MEGILTFFSECDYYLTITSEGVSGGTYQISETRRFLCYHVSEAINEGPINGLVLTDINGIPLNTFQITHLIEVLFL